MEGLVQYEDERVLAEMWYTGCPFEDLPLLLGNKNKQLVELAKKALERGHK